MASRHTILYLSFISALYLTACNASKYVLPASGTRVKPGVHPDTLHLAEKGETGEFIDQFPSGIIRAAHINTCEIWRQDSLAHGLVQKLTFDTSGRVVQDTQKDGSTSYRQYNATGQVAKISLASKPTENPYKEVYFRYTPTNQLLAVEAKEWSQKMRRRGRRMENCMPSAQDFHKKTKWLLTSKIRYFSNSNTIVGESLNNKHHWMPKVTYSLNFNQNKPLQIEQVTNNSKLSTKYIPKADTLDIFNIMQLELVNGITTYQSLKRLIFDNRGTETSEIYFEPIGSEVSRSSITYNNNGTIDRIAIKQTDNEKLLLVFRYTTFP